MPYLPSTMSWTSSVAVGDARPRDDEPSPGLWGWLTVLAVLGAFAAALVFGVPQ
ncbi:hypothetical protein DFR67_102307 [Williamsia limnetica]|uniref:Uncharacterized protein n=1 Tax=Williamsia limnetica TaxID=882452 RepID=A0A318RUT1_WILLI|nr:hypothetical protein [Williamsia limnetica]PYE20169.1 hypothetical protein DFR67_102307 [Williamsia limnetica]